MGMLFMLLAFAVGFLLMHRLQTSSMQAVRLEIDSWQWPLTAMRWSVIALIAMGWQRLIGLLILAQLIDGTRSNPVPAMRWRAIGWLLLLELVAGQGLIAAFAALAAGVGW